MNKEQINKLRQYVAMNYELCKFSVMRYDQDPHNIRNFIAGMGVELTPDQLQDHVELIREMILLIDDMEE